MKINGMDVTEADTARFWSKVDTSGSCWMWTAGTLNTGYGSIHFGGRAGKECLAHRVSYELRYGSIPVGLCVCHHCDTPGCVNPDHLFLGTIGDNNRDMYKKGRNYARTRPECLARGERANKSSLTNENIREMRSLWGTGVSQSEIARRFGVHHGTVNRIIGGKTWKHI